MRLHGHYQRMSITNRKSDLWRGKQPSRTNLVFFKKVYKTYTEEGVTILPASDGPKKKKILPQKHPIHTLHPKKKLWIIRKILHF